MSEEEIGEEVSEMGMEVEGIVERSEGELEVTCVVSTLQGTKTYFEGRV